jgi:hypothetical protein
MEASQKKCDVAIQFLHGWQFSYSLCRNFSFIFLRSKVIQEFHACAMVKKFSIFGGKYDPEKFLCKYPDPQKALP